MQATCLRDRSWIPERLDHNLTASLPGERFSADQQCLLFYLYADSLFFKIILKLYNHRTGILRYGRESRRSPQRPLNEICRDLRCTNVPSRTVRQVGGGSLSYASHPALEGTSCGDGMVRIVTKIVKFNFSS